MNFNLSKVIRFCFYFLFFVTPLLFSLNTSEIFEFNKMMLIYFVTSIIITLYGLHRIISSSKKITFSWFYILLVVFLISQIFSTIFSIDVHTSIFGYYSRWNGGLISIIAYILLFFVFVQTMSRKHIERLLILSLISSFIIILWGLSAKFGADPTCFLYLHELTNRCWTENFSPATRMFSTLGQPNWLGAYMAIHFFIGIYFLIKNLFNSEENSHPRENGDPDSGPDSAKASTVKQARMTMDSRLRGNDIKVYIKYLIRRIIKLHILKFAIYLFFNILTIYFTQSRSSQLAVLAAFMLGSVLLSLKLASKKLRKIIIAGLIIFVFFASTIGFIYKKSLVGFFELPIEQSIVTDSFDIRKIVWKGAIDLGNKYPWFGSGTETFAYAYYFTRPAAHNLTSEWDFIYNKAHNEYLNYFATTGYNGLIIYILLIIGTAVLFFQSFRVNRKNWLEVIFVTCIYLSYITILITNFFGFSISILQLFFYLIPAIFLVFEKKETGDYIFNFGKFAKLGLASRLPIIFIAIVGISLLTYFTRYYFADVHYAKAQTYLALDEYTQAAEELYKAVGNRYEHVYEDKLSGVLANTAFVRSFGDDSDSTDQLIDFSKNHNLNSLANSPYNIIYWRTQAKNYYFYYQASNDIDDLQKSIAASERVVEIAPTDAQSYYQLALYYWIISNEDKQRKEQFVVKATATINKALSLRPNYIEAQELRIQIIQ
ncbi:hypothetical protein A3A93_04035 [Candidatus Roizmanbacteria bacterium RIFCSPLOWO2_01_FULL_38_12]|uniref:O-antigen ligase-related domain-containing protein n=1 Tax=Candidatus Roizmanbacteria bacterium RIFCSPLOWO2_01_FULL_38_12 TaxID=1802061 RepID=A0A1F7IV03_9BACT|nr:MAG: hypothetical protein A2861_00590 [Candidatus Roizmanbacteria bacterium RIFCSPHIGHO2_01_FULL_38_15]OGK35021.1 MAG: hypothetical protein A3F59_00210 [Candidatus Roizmanbacteria bacterium RIFCSPHIGHO2_12_FULL_38_13]OGK47176.1 MAG: hypothetical protein A3A93_04035 [Candidatus Roizmanbacteria bacterium RIFCSPLOWO2_01_FULL_38_12]